MVAYTPSEDPQYAFAVGRVRSREARMLTRSQFDRMVDSRTENQIISSLADTPYGETRAEDAETMLERAALEEETFFKRYLADEEVQEFFTAPDLVSNLKWAMRKYYGAEMDEGLFISEGSPSIEEFSKMLAGEDSTVPDWIRQIAGQVVAANYEELDPASIDVICDRALIERRHELSKGYSFLTVYGTLKVDFTNLLALLRLFLAGEDWEEFSNVILPYGSVKVDKYKLWWDAGQEAWAAQISQVAPFSKLGEGLRYVKDDFTVLERTMKEAEIEFLSGARRLTFGYEPLVGYAMLKREERRNIGKVVAGLRYGLDSETIRKSIAWFE